MITNDGDCATLSVDTRKTLAVCRISSKTVSKSLISLASAVRMNCDCRRKTTWILTTAGLVSRVLSVMKRQEHSPAQAHGGPSVSPGKPDVGAGEVIVPS
jgi:hypothetical protein